MLKELRQLISLSSGDPMTVLETADAASGGHVAKFFTSSQTKFDDASDEMVRDGFLELSKLAEYNGTTIRVIFEILEHLTTDVEANTRLREAWASSDEPPDLRDVIVGAAQIAPAYSSTTRPIRRLYLDALRGAYEPQIFEFGLGPEVLRALMDARLTPVDVECLVKLAENGVLSVHFMSAGDVLESYERLGVGRFVQLEPTRSDGEKLIVRDRTEVTVTQGKVRITALGKRLVKMVKFGSGS